ncbi:hypothetical protein [Stenotrophomonas sp. TWI377]|uniref:hypothetical protein n=1 Tax=Stenotrophomonas sp. TWI377 TaxID=3136775 RepID=UPI003207AEA9
MNTDQKIASTAQAFNAAAAELADAMLAKLQQQDPVIAAKVAQVLQSGERMVLSWEMNPAAPSIWWATIDEYQQMKRIMTIPGTGGAHQH